MRYIIAAMVSFWFLSCIQAQTVKIHMMEEDSSYFINDVINAAGDNVLYCKGGNLSFSRIKAVMFYEEPIDQVVEKLNTADIKVVDRYSDTMYASDLMKLRPPSNLDDPQVSKNFNPEGSINQVSGGKALQFLGMGLVVGALLIVNADLPDNFTQDDLDRRQGIINGFSIVGGLSFGVGSIIEFNGIKEFFDRK
ncbi:hypothetical protein [Marinoscillum sp. MHG1-6]|uniref:hypothetical protein n=1 Tax=Marinoscillum sp. MHG1-6 TaxID=2959627 RepID=UPI00215754CF|nr:hypothetical protein [Marinoscillum sp. MHG1-6]